MKKRSRPKIDRPVQDKKFQDAVQDAGKSQVTCSEAQDLNGEAAGLRITGEDDYWTQLACDRLLLKKAIGIDDDDFCEGLVLQLYGITPTEDYGDRTNFNFVISFLGDEKPVDKTHAMLAVQKAACHLAVMKQTQVLLKPVKFELPADFRQAIHDAKYDTSRLDKQKIKVDDQPARQAGERSLTRLMQTFALLVQTSDAYRRSVEASKGQQVSAITGGRALLTDCTEATSHEAQKTAAARPSQGVNGSPQSAGQLNGTPKQEMNSINVQKNNGHASS